MNISKPNLEKILELLNNVFKEWFQANYSGRKIPKLMELEEVMDKKFEKRLNKGGMKEWINIKLKLDDGEDNDNVFDTDNCA